MRTLFTLWAAPMAIFWGWFFLSANDMNFGYVMLSRQVHDFAFQLYGQMLGIDPAIIPGHGGADLRFRLFPAHGAVGLPPPAQHRRMDKAAPAGRYQPRSARPSD